MITPRWVHAKLAPKMPQLWWNNRAYEGFREYDAHHSSVLATLPGAKRQPGHADTLCKALSALVAIDQPFRLIVFPGSHKALARLNELHTLFYNVGVDFPDVEIDQVGWWDRLGKHLLQEEGYALEGPVTIEVPPGCALIFDAWLLHAGCEYRAGDADLNCRLHFYFLDHKMSKNTRTVNMHEVQAVSTRMMMIHCS